MHKYEKSLRNQNPGKLIDVTQCHVLQLAEVGMNKEGYFYLFATMVIMSPFFYISSISRYYRMFV